MRYASIRKMDISNGPGVGVSLFVQGCDINCPGCFNKETWDFNGGKEWDEETEEIFLSLADRPQIKRISILGGEPLAKRNVEDVLLLVKKIKKRFPQKALWLFTGYNFEDFFFQEESSPLLNVRKEILKNCDVVVDGEFIQELKDISLVFRGSANQRVIDVKKSIELGKIQTC